MRPPFKDVFAVEPLSKWKLATVAALAVLLSAAVAVVLARHGLLVYAESVLSSHIDSMVMDRVLWIAAQRIWIAIGLMAFANVFVGYWILRFIDSAEIRVVLRWSLHVLIWSEMFYLISMAWTYATFL